MVKIGGRNISYDYENRPTTIVMPTEEGKIITYTYDYAGQRVKKEVTEKDRAEQALTRIAERLEELGFSQFSRIFERFILQRASRPSPPQPAPPRRGSPPQQNPPSQESEITYYIGNLYEVGYSSTTTVTTKYIYANGVRVADVRYQPVPTVASGMPDVSRSVSYYHSDHLGSSNIITDAQGNKVQLLEYVPFGQTRLSQGNADVSYRFTGQMLDNDAGLYYYSARWYEPVIGKFITPDTIIQAPYDPQTLNRYAYCRNNPVKYIDPTGNLTIGTGGIVGISDGMGYATLGSGTTTTSQTGTSQGDSKVFEGKKAPEGTVETTTTTPTVTTKEGEKGKPSSSDKVRKSRAGKDNDEKNKSFWEKVKGWWDKHTWRGYSSTLLLKGETISGTEARDTYSFFTLLGASADFSFGDIPGASDTTMEMGIGLGKHFGIGFQQFGLNSAGQYEKGNVTIHMGLGLGTPIYVTVTGEDKNIANHPLTTSPTNLEWRSNP